VPSSWNLEFFRNLVVQMIALILSIAVHEFGHAIVADRLGDRLPRSQGRVTLNPRPHRPARHDRAPPDGHPLRVGAIGWGKPVHDPALAFTRKLRHETGHLLVALAGPIMNILFGVVISLVGLLLLRTAWCRTRRILRSIFWSSTSTSCSRSFNLLPFRRSDRRRPWSRGCCPDRSKVVSSSELWPLPPIAVMAIPYARFLYAAPAAPCARCGSASFGIR